MSSINRLKVALVGVFDTPLAVPEVPALLRQQVLQLEKSLGSAGALHPPRDRMKEAVALFRRSRALTTLSEGRLVCFGCAERFASGEPALIEDRHAFPQLIYQVDEYLPEPRSFRRCYRGLLHTYFSYDGEGASTPGPGRENWSDLRSYLQKRLSAIRAEGLRPDWVDAIETNGNLLSPDPASRYANKLLDGDGEEVNALRSRLEIKDGSWLIRKLILAQIEAATRESHSRFSSRTEGLLKLLEGHPALENEGLGLLLDRYAEIRDPPQHAVLRDRAVLTWGNPTFSRYSTEWSRVSPAAKQMISTWATLDIIREFFEVLSEDRQTDQRRVEFWQRYHEQINGMYFALGSAARNARDADAKRVRAKMGDHLLTLKRAGSSSNNAFIMLMGDIVAVEFGLKGNACYLYEKGSLPFALRGEVTGEELRGADHLERLTHMDSSYEPWEEKFATALSARGIRATAAAVMAPIVRRHADPPRSVRADRETGRGLTKYALERFVREHQLVWSDLTDQGGFISVISSQQTGSIADTLKSWGFSYSERRLAWYRRGWE